MKKFKIVYQWGINRLVAEIKAADLVQAEYIFLTQYGPGAIIEKIQEVTTTDGEEDNQ